MITDEQKKTIVEIIVDGFGLEEDDITEKKSLKGDLGFDYIDVIDLSIRLEKTFSIQIDDDEMNMVKTIKELYKMIDKLIN